MISQGVASLNAGLVKYGSACPTKWLTSELAAAATSNGPRLSIAIDPKTISATNKAAATVTLYTAAIPPAAPQATINRHRGVDILAPSPNHEASVADNCTIAPSRPIEPPDPMVMSDETVFARLRRTLILSRCTATASM